MSNNPEQILRASMQDFGESKSSSRSSHRLESTSHTSSKYDSPQHCSGSSSHNWESLMGISDHHDRSAYKKGGQIKGYDKGGSILPPDYKQKTGSYNPLTTTERLKNKAEQLKRKELLKNFGNDQDRQVGPTCAPQSAYLTEQFVHKLHDSNGDSIGDNILRGQNNNTKTANHPSVQSRLKNLQAPLKEKEPRQPHLEVKNFVNRANSNPNYQNENYGKLPEYPDDKILDKAVSFFGGGQEGNSSHPNQLLKDVYINSIGPNDTPGATQLKKPYENSVQKEKDFIEHNTTKRRMPVNIGTNIHYASQNPERHAMVITKGKEYPPDEIKKRVARYQKKAEDFQNSHNPDFEKLQKNEKDEYQKIYDKHNLFKNMDRLGPEYNFRARVYDPNFDSTNNPSIQREHIIDKKGNAYSPRRQEKLKANPSFLSSSPPPSFSLDSRFTSLTTPDQYVDSQGRLKNITE